MARTKNLSNVSTDALSRELHRRARRLPALRKQRASLVRRLEEIDAEIGELGGQGGGARAGAAGTARGRAGQRGAAGGRGKRGGGARRRARNDGNLLEWLHKTLKGKTLGVTEAAAAVQKAGYKTTSPNFRTIVNQTLLNKKHFRRVSRGQYTAK